MLLETGQFFNRALWVRLGLSQPLMPPHWQAPSPLRARSEQGAGRCKAACPGRVNTAYVLHGWVFIFPSMCLL